MLKLDPIAIAHSPYKEKFAIPRQPGLAPSVRTRIELLAPYNDPLALSGLEQVSHLWLTFYFHQVGARPDSLRVRPPRLGGNERLGVFATRSTHRPNGLGQSLVKIEQVSGTTIIVSGADLLDGTPILDLKPYIPYADSAPDAVNTIAPHAPQALSVHWREEAMKAANAAGERLQEPVKKIIEECLGQDPRPAYQAHDSKREYGVHFWDLNVRWQYPTHTSLLITGVDQAPDSEL